MLRSVPTVNGRCWEFSHNGVDYQIINYNGSEKVTLYYRGLASGDTTWHLGHSRTTNGFGAKGVAQEIYDFITTP